MGAFNFNIGDVARALGNAAKQGIGAQNQITQQEINDQLRMKKLRDQYLSQFNNYAKPMAELRSDLKEDELQMRQALLEDELAKKLQYAIERAEGVEKVKLPFFQQKEEKKTTEQNKRADHKFDNTAAGAKIKQDQKEEKETQDRVDDVFDTLDSKIEDSDKSFENASEDALKVVNNSSYDGTVLHATLLDAAYQRARAISQRKVRAMISSNPGLSAEAKRRVIDSLDNEAYLKQLRDWSVKELGFLVNVPGLSPLFGNEKGYARQLVEQSGGLRDSAATKMPMPLMTPQKTDSSGVVPSIDFNAMGN